MSNETAIAVSVLLGAGVITTVVLMLPPLTFSGGASISGVSQERFEALQASEKDYCQTNPQGVNCNCFARTSGLIQAYEGPRYRDAVYADQTDLARSQARASC